MRKSGNHAAVGITPSLTLDLARIVVKHYFTVENSSKPATRYLRDVYRVDKDG